MFQKIKKETKIGLLVVISSAILIWGINYLKGIEFFRDEVSYFAIYERIDGLVESSPVQINGYDVGQVRKIYFHPDNSGRIVVHFIIEKEFNLPLNTVALIASTDLMGTKAIKLILGDTSAIHQPGDTLLAQFEGTIKEQVSMQMLPLKTKAEDLMHSMESALAIVEYIFNEKTRENLQKSFASIKKTVSYLEHSTMQLDTLVSQQKSRLARIFINIESISGNLKNHNKELSNAIKNLSAISDTIAKARLAQTLIKTTRVVEDAGNIITKINKGEGSLGLLIYNDSLYNNLEQASKNLNKLILDIQENPKKYVHYSLIDFGGKKDKKKKKNNKKNTAK